MANHRALIVDDSKTAQHRLKRMLNKYDLDIDMSNSAEEALGYLTHTMPSVIFMDHHMEGMDGLEALKIIKANPSTAVIPVIMYTSQSGDVYVGRAHALGALDILSKEVIKAANIDAVLAKLKIQISEGEAAEFALQNEDQNSSTDPNEDVESEASSLADEASALSSSDDIDIDENIIVHSPLTDDDSTNLKNQVARLFELHIADVRTQITENTKFMIRRLTSEIKTATNETPKDTEKSEAEDMDGQTVDTATGLFLYPILMILILIGVIFVAFKLVQLDNKNIDADLLFQEIESIKSQMPNYENSSGAGNNSEFFIDNTYDSYEILEAISVATNLETHFEFKESPFNDDNLTTMLDLIEQLDISGFKGLIEVSVHTGNFCVVADEAGELTLAASTALIGSCIFSKDQPNTRLELWTNEAYEQLEILAVPIQQGDIELIFVARDEEPKVSYPEQSTTMKAETWNTIATQNNYLTLRFESEE